MKLLSDDKKSKCFVLPSVSVGVSETIGEEGEAGSWQPISAISLQQSFQI